MKCGIKGDRRFMHATCHSHEGYFHVKPMSWKHCGTAVARHRGSLKSQPSTGWAHVGIKQQPHKDKIIAFHSGGTMTSIVFKAMFKMYNAVSQQECFESGDWRYYTCCNTAVNKARPCALQWACCYKDSSCESCPEAPITWSCCGEAVYSKGCQQIERKKDEVSLYSCCGKEEGSGGCEMVWDCCQSDDKGQGCEIYYDCCGRDTDSQGCVLKCVNCRSDWGKGSGCVPVRSAQEMQ